MTPIVGQICLFGFDFAPPGWFACDGSLIPISENETLFQVLGNKFGGDGENTFGLPNLQAAAPSGCHYCISWAGYYQPSSYEYLIIGETMLTPAPLGPKNLMPCGGQSLLISDYRVLEAFMGTRFGGDATHFSLPNLANQAPSNFQYMIAVQGNPPTNLSQRKPFLAQIFLLPYQETQSQSLVPCNGAQLPIAQNTALYNLIGTTFGGSGTNFAVPNLTAPSNYTYYIVVSQGVFPPRP